MKIAIITRGFTGSTLPLAKQMVEDGHTVHFYIICNRMILDDIEALECNFKANRLGVSSIPNSAISGIREYMGDLNHFSVYCVRFVRPYQNVPYVGRVMDTINKLLTKNAISQINGQKYDLVNIVGGYYSSEYNLFLDKLNKKPIVSLHEVCDHFAPKFDQPSSFLSKCFKEKIPLVIYSENTYKDILKYKDVNPKLIHRINFGMFTSFQTIQGDNSLVLPRKYILFFGTLKKYKGLNILLEAITKYEVLPDDTKCVVAGAGNDESFDQMTKDDRFFCIKKRLSNSELVRLISESIFVVCPYLTMSQSGIPQTVFVFNKPIVASNLDGFKEILDESNSLLFNTADSEDLSSKIRRLLADEILYRDLIEGIIKLRDCEFSPYSWTYIAKQYYKLV